MPAMVALTELRRRAGLVSVDLGQWQKAALANNEFMGIHGSQLAALQRMFATWEAEQSVALAKLTADLPAVDFAKAHRALTDEIVAVNDLWRAFRLILAQQLDPRFSRDMAFMNVLAAECYNDVMDVARSWQLASAAESRPPPLAYLTAIAAPETVNRKGLVGQLGLAVRDLEDVQLPIPVVFVPIDQAGVPWTFVAIHHEVGHNLDQDLSLSDELAKVLYDGIKGADEPRARAWFNWTMEVLADVFGMLLGGAGFAMGLTELLQILAAAEEGLEVGESHPPHLVRMHLLAALLGQKPSGAAAPVPQWQAAAQRIRRTAAAISVAAWAQGYVADCPAVAALCLETKLQALGGRTLRELNPNTAAEAVAIEKLATYFETGLLKPNLAKPRWRWVPPAAQLALLRRFDAAPPQSENDVVAVLDDVQSKVASYTATLEVPTWLSAPRDYSAAMARRLTRLRAAY